MNDGAPSPDRTITCTAWAKVNLTLHVTGRRPAGAPAAGYHELDSLIVFAGIGDELSFAPADALGLTVEGPFAAAVETSDDNLVLRAAHRLAAHLRLVPRAKIRLVKRLPVAAGIGGGSADAAAALRGLCRLWRVAPPPDELAALALALGADVPICLRGEASFVSGIGDVLRSAPPLPPAWLLLVNPGRPLATPAVFQARQGPFSRPEGWADAPVDAVDLTGRLARGRNDLEAAACRLVPEIALVLDALGATPGCLLARMSGSGATCFGLYESRAEAQAAAHLLRSGHGGWWVEPAPLLTGPAL